MEKTRIDMYLTASAKYFEAAALPLLRQKMEQADDSILASLQAADLRDPTTILLVSILLGTFGIDRFMIGDFGMGILKLLTGGCCGILTVIDWFLISGKTKQKNMAKVSMFL